VAVSDGRLQQAREHPAAAVLTLAAAAVVAGMQSFIAIAGWVLDVAPHVVQQLYSRCGMAPALPSRSTLWRVLTGADGVSVDAAVGAWLAARYAATAGAQPKKRMNALMVDGETLRGAADADGHHVHLLAAASHNHALVLAQTEVGAKTNEIPMFTSLLDGLDITGLTVTADALHTQRSHAAYLYRRGADFVLMIKDNQPNLFAAPDRLDWRDVPIGHAGRDQGHGRIELRTIQVMPAPADLPFPHTNQVFLVERGVTDLHGRSLSNVAIFGVTSLTADRANPPSWPNSSVASGVSKACTGRATPSTERTSPPPTPDPGRESWPHSAASPSARHAYSAAPTSPKPHAGPRAT
jgi:predicted transposase YbfD/YdcC